MKPTPNWATGDVFADGNHNGNHTIKQANDITFQAGDDFFAAYAQLGNGGRFADGNHNGNHTIEQANDITFQAGDFFAYAQLGNGGISADGNHSGNHTIEQANDITFHAGDEDAAYAQLGNGGLGIVGGNHNGNHTIEQANDITFQAGDEVAAYAQLGNGGLGIVGNHNGNHTIEQANDITFQAGDFFAAYAQLGNGGRSADGNHNGNHTIEQANDITFHAGDGGDAYAQLGNGGISADGNHNGNHTIEQANDITFHAGDGDDAYAQLGNGGIFADGNHNGNHTIEQANDITFHAGDGGDAYAQLGNGGISADGNHSGTIDVTTGGNLVVNGQNTTNRYAIIGHGDQPGDGDTGHTVAGDVMFRIGRDATLTNAVIGHQIDAGGTYVGGNTFLSIGNNNYSGANLTNKLTSDAASRIVSSPNSNGGQLRLYLPRRDSLNMADGATLNGVDVAAFPATGPLPNEQGDHAPFTGPYNVNQADGNFAFYFPIIDLIVNANGGMSIYGDNPVDPGLMLADGVLNPGDTLGSIGLTNNFSLTATSNAGSYVLMVDNSVLDAAYNLASSTNGTFTINPAALTITALNLIKPLGTTGIPDETTDFATAGLKNGETVGSVTLTSAGYPSSAGAGVYPIVISNPVGGTFNPANYTITLVNGNLLVAVAGSGVSTSDEFTRYIDFFTTVQSLLNPTGPPATNDPPTNESNEENNSPNSAQPENNNNPQGDEIIIPEIRVTGV